jgi:hypothetical protein
MSDIATPTRRMPNSKEWQAILDAIGPSGVSPCEHLPLWIHDQRQIMAKLQDCVQRNKLGLGGGPVHELLIQAVDRCRREHRFSIPQA